MGKYWMSSLKDTEVRVWTEVQAYDNVYEQMLTLNGDKRDTLLQACDKYVTMFSLWGDKHETSMIITDVGLSYLAQSIENCFQPVFFNLVSVKCPLVYKWVIEAVRGTSWTYVCMELLFPFLQEIKCNLIIDSQAGAYWDVF